MASPRVAAHKTIDTSQHRRAATCGNRYSAQQVAEPQFQPRPASARVWNAVDLAQSSAIFSTMASPRSNGSLRNSMPSPGPSGGVTKPSLGTGTFLIK